MKKVIAIIVLLLLVVSGLFLRGCIQVDKCLDSGGRWDFEKENCEHE